MTLRNRFIMVPMTTYSANADDMVSNEEIVYYEGHSDGAGMIITACAYVVANEKAFPGQFSAHEDRFIPGLRKVAQAIQKGGAKAVLQIHHGGRQALSHLVPIGDVVSVGIVPTIEKGLAGELAIEEVNNLIQTYGEATRRAI